MQCPSCKNPIEGNPPFCPSCGSPIPRAAGPDPLIGRTLAGKYRIVQMLGEGGMGAVYVGEQAMGNRTRKVAIKTLHAHLSRDEKIRERFGRECGTLAGLEHPNTVQVYDFGTTDDGLLYIVMEFVHGRSIADVLEKEGPMRPDRVEKIVAQIAGSLGEAHAQGIIHRDLKPDNIILSERAGQRDFVKVLDFGIAKRSSEDKNEKKLTQQGMVLGTPPYMSPEQFTGQALDARSDIYSLAVMAYEMLTGQLPFDAKSAFEWATLHMTAAPKAIEAAPNGAMLPESMRSAIMKALSKSADQRFTSIGEFLDRFMGRSAPTPQELAQKNATAASQAPPRGTAGMPGAPAAPYAAAPAPAVGAAPADNQKGKTQIGEPLPFAAGGFGPSPAPPAYGAPPGAIAPAQAAPAYGPPGSHSYATPAGVPQAPPRVRRGGGNKGIIVGAIGGVAVISIVLLAWGLGAFHSSASEPTELPTATATTPTPTAQPTSTDTSATSSTGGTAPPLTTTTTPPLTSGGTKPPSTHPTHTTPHPTTPPPPPPSPTPSPHPTPSPTPPPPPPPAPTPTPTPTPHPPPPPPPPPPPAPTPTPTPPKAEPQVCALARSARASGNPMAGRLEAQCRAAGGVP